MESQYGAKVDETLKLVFGHSGFRSNQREIVMSFLGGKDCFVLIPTGAFSRKCPRPFIAVSMHCLILSMFLLICVDRCRWR